MNACLLVLQATLLEKKRGRGMFKVKVLNFTLIRAAQPRIVLVLFACFTETRFLQCIKYIIQITNKNISEIDLVEFQEEFSYRTLCASLQILTCDPWPVTCNL